MKNTFEIKAGIKLHIFTFIHAIHYEEAFAGGL